jgi:hypothetical protein
VARNLAYKHEEERFLADKTFAPKAEVCRQNRVYQSSRKVKSGAFILIS